jgi:hypothetical protein
LVVGSLTVAVCGVVGVLHLVLVGMKGDVLKTAAPVQFDLPGLWASTLVILAQALVLVSVVSLLTRPRFHSLAQDSVA